MRDIANLGVLSSISAAVTKSLTYRLRRLLRRRADINMPTDLREAKMRGSMIGVLTDSLLQKQLSICLRFQVRFRLGD